MHAEFFCKKHLVKLQTMMHFLPAFVRESVDSEGENTPSDYCFQDMRLLGTVLVWLLFASAPLTGWSAESSHDPASEAAAGVAAHAAHGLPQKAVPIARVWGFPITNSMVVTWTVALGLIVFAQIATRKMKLIPTGAQNFREWMVESLYDFLEGIIGSALVKKTFWFFATDLYLHSVHQLGRVDSRGWARSAGAIKTDARLRHRPAVAARRQRRPEHDPGHGDDFFRLLDLSGRCRTIGPIGFLGHLFAPKGETTGLLKVLMVVVFFAVGFLEVFSILFRPISLSFRLYGNIFAGENMLEAMARLVPGLGWLLPVPFYFMELLVGFVQALVFMLLTAVFTMLICEHEEGHEPSRHH